MAKRQSSRSTNGTRRGSNHTAAADPVFAEPQAPAVPVKPASAAEPPTFRWYVDEISAKGVVGWIASNNDPLQHCTVVLREGGRALVRGIASRFRADLLAAGVGDGCYAFDLAMPESLLDGNDHLLEVVEEGTGFTLTDGPVPWNSKGATNAWANQMSSDAVTALDAAAGNEIAARRPGLAAKGIQRAAPKLGIRLLFDISDLVYYLSEHPNLTGIQRVQSSIVLAMIDGGLVDPASLTFLSFNARERRWVTVPTNYLVSLLRNLFLPHTRRNVQFSKDDARYGLLPGATPFDGVGVLDDGKPSVLCVLGAAWVHQDYAHRVLAWKQRFGTRFVMTVHDLIPIYARETCDQDTARVFEEFMRRTLGHIDHILAVSENTARDVRRYLSTLRLPEPEITVTKNGSSFSEFLQGGDDLGESALHDLPKRFVLCVATIEGRKNHQLILDLWQRMIELGDEPPHLICVGRLGWKASAFVSALVETHYLGGRVHLLREVSDTDLRTLYERCLFTICPSLYEGWGLPVGESLAMGAICVCSNRASIPEVAGNHGVYINIDDFEQSLGVVRDLIRDDSARRALKAAIRRNYVPITWRSVAQRVVEACTEAVKVKWEDPYPFSVVPYSTEVSFGKLDQDIDGTGELLLTRIVGARLGHFSADSLDKRSFQLGEAIRSGGAWAYPEAWGTWLCHGGGDVVFALPAESSAHYFVFLRLRVCGVLEHQPIRIAANGERLWDGKIGPGSKDLMLRVPKRDSANNPWKLRLGAHVDLSREQVSQIAALDARIPTIGFERMIVVPENDVKARLDVLSNFAMQGKI